MRVETLQKKERKERHVYINEQTNSNGTTENEYYYNTEPVRYQKGREREYAKQSKKQANQQRENRKKALAGVTTWSDSQRSQNDEISMQRKRNTLPQNLCDTLYNSSNSHATRDGRRGAT